MRVNENKEETIVFFVVKVKKHPMIESVPLENPLYPYLNIFHVVSHQIYLQPSHANVDNIAMMYFCVCSFYVDLI